MTSNASTFVIPSNYSIEPELRGDPPREVPPDLRFGRIERISFRISLTLIFFGIVLLLVSPLPAIAFVGLFFLPLQYLDWIGMGLIAFGVIGFLVRNLRKSSKYISHGIPMVLRILCVVKRPTRELHGEFIYATCIMVECQDPRTGQTIQREIKTDSKDVPFRAGDYVTGIYFPDDFETTLQIYSLLGFHRKDGLSDSSYEWWLGIKMVTLVCSILAVPVFCLFVFARWFIRDPWTLVTLWGIGALVFGIPTAWLWHRTYRRKDIQRQQRNLHAITEGGILEQLAPPRAGFIGTGRITGSVLFFGVLMGMGIVFLSLALAINGGLDSSKPKDVPVSIVDIRVTTRKMIIREYELGYRFANDNETYHLHTRRLPRLGMGGNDKKEVTLTAK